MRLIYADYNPQTNSIDVTTFENYILRIDCNKAEDGLKTTPCSQNSLNALAIDEPLEYARLREGKIVGQGTFEELLRTDSYFMDLYNANVQ